MLRMVKRKSRKNPLTINETKLVKKKWKSLHNPRCNRLQPPFLSMANLIPYSPIKFRTFNHQILSKDKIAVHKTTAFSVFWHIFQENRSRKNIYCLFIWPEYLALLQVSICTSCWQWNVAVIYILQLIN